MNARARKYLDALERLLKTLIQTAAAAVLVEWQSEDGIDSWEDGAKVAGIAALFSLLTSAASWKIGNNETSSALPASSDPATPPGQGP